MTEMRGMYVRDNGSLNNDGNEGECSRDNGMNEGLSEGVDVDKFGHGAPNSCQNDCKRLFIRAIIGHMSGEVALNECQNKWKTPVIRAVIGHMFREVTLDISPQ